MRTKMMAMRTDENTQIKALLTDDQKPKYDAYLASMPQGGRGGGGGGGGADASSAVVTCKWIDRKAGDVQIPGLLACVTRQRTLLRVQLGEQQSHIGTTRGRFFVLGSGAGAIRSQCRPACKADYAARDVKGSNEE